MLLYNIILNILFLPFILIFLIISVLNRRLRKTILCRIGFSKIKSREKRTVWFHCSSLGEFNAIKNLIYNLQKEYKEIFVTTLTDTGFEAAQKLLGKQNVSILPLDFNFLIKKAIKKINPLFLVIEETEIWPNLIWQSYKLNVPVIYTNCIISKKSFFYYRALGFIFKTVLNKIDVFFIQNKETGQFLNRLGIASGKIKSIGNIKFDIKLKKDPIKIRKQLNIKDRIIITAGSTRSGEERILLNIYRELRVVYKKLLLILAPRHIKRINEVSALIKKFHFRYSLYSKPKAGLDILLVDKIGVLIDMYAISHISFIGGTMVPVGGHNPLEAASFKKPVLAGQYINKNREAFRKIVSKKGGFIVKNKNELYARLKDLLSSKNKMKKMGKNAYKVLKENQGVTKKIINFLKIHYIDQ